MYMEYEGIPTKVERGDVATYDPGAGSIIVTRGVRLLEINQARELPAQIESPNQFAELLSELPRAEGVELGGIFKRREVLECPFV